MSEEIMYTPTGQKVKVVRKIEEGYLGYEIYGYGGEYDDGIEEWPSDAISFFPILHDEAPTKKYSSKIGMLKDDIKNLQAELNEARSLVRKEKSLLSKIGKFPILHQVHQFVTRDYEFTLWLEDLDVDKKTSHNINKWIIAKEEDKPISMYRIRDGVNYGEKKPFMVFRDMESLEKESKEIILKWVKEWGRKYDWTRSKDFKNHFDKFCFHNPAKKDHEVLAAFNARFNDLLAAEKVKAAEDAKKKIEAAQAELERLESK